MLAGCPCAVWPITLLTPRGAAALPTIFHSTPLFPLVIRNIGPAWLGAITLGRNRGRLELKGASGNDTRPVETRRSGSTMLITSPPELATYNVLASGVSAI